MGEGLEYEAREEAERLVGWRSAAGAAVGVAEEVGGSNGTVRWKRKRKYTPAFARWSRSSVCSRINP